MNWCYQLGALYVGDLHPDITEAMLYEKFSTVGPLMSLRVCRDAITRKSLGYAYVNYQHPSDAERALDTMNFDMMKGKPIRIMWSQRDPSLRKSGVGNLFIKNLDKSIDNKSMFDTFSAFGTILSCKVVMDENGISRGYGFIHFDSEQAAERAIEKVNGMLLNQKKVYVGKFIPHKERCKDGTKPKIFTNVYVKNMPDMTEEKLFDLFSKYGNITSSVVMRTPEGTSRGFGFVAFEEPEAAERAVSELHDSDLDVVLGGNGNGNGSSTASGSNEGSNASVSSTSTTGGGVSATPSTLKLYVAKAQKKAERQMELKRRYDDVKIERYNRMHGVNLFLKNLDDTIDDARLRKEFAPFGTITSAKVMIEDGRSKGFGFVCFSSPDEATKAMMEMHGKMLGGKPIYVAIAQRKEDRKAYIASYLQRVRVHPTTTAVGGGIFAAAAAPPPPTPHQYLMPAVAAAAAAAGGAATTQAHRFYSMNHFRAAAAAAAAGPRWLAASTAAAAAAAAAATIRPNGTYPPPPPAAIANSLYRVSSRQSAQSNPSRNSITARPITGGQSIHATRPNSKYTTAAAAANQHQQLIRPVTLASLSCNVNNNNGGDGGSISSPVSGGISNTSGSGGTTGGVGPLNATTLASATAEDQKQILGAKLFPHVEKMYPEMAGKITGMLLEIDTSELIHMIEDHDSLRAKVEEAIAVLQAHQEQTSAAAQQQQVIQQQAKKVGLVQD